MIIRFIYISIIIKSKFKQKFSFYKKKCKKIYNIFLRIIRSEVPFKQIKALSEQHAIGIDYDSILWKYINGTWTWIIRTASINYNGDIF
jgi:hypothetical protein